MIYFSQNVACLFKKEYKLCNGEKSFYEYYATTDGKKMIRLADIEGKSNLIVKFDISELSEEEE